MNLKNKYKQLFEGRLRSNDSELINEADVFGGGDSSADDTERDVEKLNQKFAGPIEPVIKLINTKEELSGAVKALIDAVEQEKPGLAKKTKMLLRKMVQDL